MREIGDTISGADVSAGREAASIIQSGIWPDNARQMHKNVGIILTGKGFEVWSEVPTGGMGDDRSGRIDLVAIKNGGRVAIEIDCRKPRLRSLKKLRLFKGYRLVVLRGIAIAGDIEGIDQSVAARVYI